MTWLCALIVMAAADASQPAARFDAFFADFAKKRDAIATLDARFTQRDISKEETIESGGEIVYVKPRRIVFRYDKLKNGATYLIQDRKAYEYEPDVKQLQIYNLEDNPQAEIFFLGFDNDTEALCKAYEVAIFESNDAPVGTHGLAIRPKEGDAKEGHFREVKVYLRDSDYLPYRIHIQNDNDSEVDIAVTDIQPNAKLDPGKAKIALAEGTKVIENDELVETVGAGGKSVPSDDIVVSTPLPEPAKKDEPKP